MRGRRILIPLPNTGSMYRKRHTYYIRGIIVVSFVIFLVLQLHTLTYTDPHETMLTESTNYTTDAILSQVPVILHKFLKPKVRNNSKLSLVAANFLHNTSGGSGTSGNLVGTSLAGEFNATIMEIRHQIAKQNDMQLVLNEDTFGPLQNDSVIIVVQVHTRITYLRHLIVSLAQARDISKTLIIFSHDYYDDDINDLVQSIDFCKVMQIFYPFSIQTHPNEFPGVDPNDCPRNIKKDQAIKQKCNNANYPDLFDHYREAKFTQTKHHWWWKANQIFEKLDITHNYGGLVLFLEEDHYVAEDFLYLLEIMNKRTADLCPKCNILSLGTYLKTFNYYTYSQNHKKSLNGQYATQLLNKNNKLLAKSKNGDNKSSSLSSLPLSSLSSSSSSSSSSISSSVSSKTDAVDKNANHKFSNGIYTLHQIITTTTTTTKMTNNDKKVAQQTWSYHVLPSLYSVYQKVVYHMPRVPITPNITIAYNYRQVEVTPWISSKHNMGFAFNRSTWNSILNCAQQFCSYDDYNWDWSLQHVSQQCMQRKLYTMIVKGPRVFHIGECGIHHKKNNCESNQVISKVQQVLRIANKAGQMFPRSLTLAMAAIAKNNKFKKGNGGWGDRRDHELCLNMTLRPS